MHHDCGQKAEGRIRGGGDPALGIGCVETAGHEHADLAHVAAKSQEGCEDCQSITRWLGTDDHRQQHRVERDSGQKADDVEELRGARGEHHAATPVQWVRVTSRERRRPARLARLEPTTRAQPTIPRFAQGMWSSCGGRPVSNEWLPLSRRWLQAANERPRAADRPRSPACTCHSSGRFDHSSGCGRAASRPSGNVPALGVL
jgi:hypothetical protein